jgi:hypothetical protein
MNISIVVLWLLSVPLHEVAQNPDSPALFSIAEASTVERGADRDTADILLVDDDGGMSYEQHLIQALVRNSYVFDVWSVQDSGLGPDASEMVDYGAVIWNTGDENQETLTELDTFNIGGYLIALQGNLWLIGQDILYDFKYSHNPPWDYPSWMNVVSHGEDVGVDSAIGVGGDPVTDNLRLGLHAGYLTDRSDTIVPTSTYDAFYRKIGGAQEGTNAIRIQGIGDRAIYKFFFQTFPFENIDSLADTLVSRVLTWFGYPPPSYTLDAMLQSIDAPGHILVPGSTYSPEVTVTNLSSVPQNFWALFSIDSMGIEIYRDSVQVPQLASGESYPVTFADFDATPEKSGMSYVLTAWTRLTNDEYPNNDTLRAVSSIDIIETGRAVTAPDIDGVLSFGEWDDAVVVDISDRLGAIDDANAPSSCLLYLMNDYNSLYMAYEMILDSTPGDGDQVLFRLDDDGDGTWATDSSEGSHFVVARVAEDYSIFIAEPSGYTVNDPGAPEFSISLLPYRVFEMAMDFGHEKWELSGWPGDTIGFLSFALNRPGGFPDDIMGMWPTSLPSPNWSDPGSFGRIFLTYVCGDVNGDGLVNAEDVGALAEYLMASGPVPFPLKAGDANGDGIITAADAAYLVNYLYHGGPPPVCDPPSEASRPEFTK